MVKHIPIKVYEEINIPKEVVERTALLKYLHPDISEEIIEWQNINGLNIPFKVTIINNKENV